MWSYAHGERLQDRLVWMELRWFGFTKLLRTRVATNSGDELTDAARTALSTMIQGHAKTVVRVPANARMSVHLGTYNRVMAWQPGGEQLTFEELNRWLLAMDERPVPRSTFLQAAQPEATVGHVVDADGVYACFVEEETQLDPARSKVWRIATRHHGFDGCLRNPEQRRVLFENRRNARITRTQGARRCYLRLLGRWSDAWWRCKRRVRRSITPFAYGIAEGNGETAYHWPLSQQELIRKQNRAFLQVRAAVCTVSGPW